MLYPKPCYNEPCYEEVQVLQPLYNTMFGVQTNIHFNYPNRVISRVKCRGYKEKGSLIIWPVWVQHWAMLYPKLCYKEVEVYKIGNKAISQNMFKFCKLFPENKILLDFWVQIIRIFNGCEVLIENSVMTVTVWHHKACRVMPNSYLNDGIFNLHRRTITNSFSCILFLRQLHLDLNMSCFFNFTLK